MRKINLAIIGATGLVGSTFIKVLEEKKHIQIDNLYLFASQKSAGKIKMFREKEYEVLLLDESNFIRKKIDYALFSAGKDISKLFAPMFAKQGAIVIDNSSAWRMMPEYPLIVPQVNMEDVYENCGIIANPNCSTIQCMAILKIVDSLFGLQRVDYSTYQAVSGSGVKGLNDFFITSRLGVPEFYPYPIYNNCLPHIDSFNENGYSNEELKMINETKKILHLPNLNVSATCVRVPVENAHSIGMSIVCKNEIDVKLFRNKLEQVESIKILDEPQNNIYPIATIATDTDNIYVGRIRRDLFNKHMLHLFCVADNVRKGAASNAIEIMEKLIDNEK